MTALAGRRILVTRPGASGQALTAQLREAGARVLHFPTLLITPEQPAEPPGDARWPPDLLLFVSPNAVRYGLELPMLRQALGRARVGAIGPSTAAALREAGVDVDMHAVGGASSEALLEQPQLRRVRGRNIVIVRGRGGRRLLRDELIARGARVGYLEVYRRRRPAPGAARIERVKRFLAQPGGGWLVATSGEALENLLAMVDGVRLPMRHWRLVTSSDRLLRTGAARGLDASMAPARGPSPADLLAAIVLDARRSDSGTSQ